MFRILTSSSAVASSPALLNESASNQELARLRALEQSLTNAYAHIEFDPNGVIQFANQAFLAVFGYKEHEVLGQHHRMLVEADYAESPAYRQFWNDLRKGKSETATYKCLAKDGHEIYIHATYLPIVDPVDSASKIVVYATDVTEEKIEEFTTRDKLEGISRYQAVIEFELDGTIITANQNFLNAVGYRLDDIVGRHHRIFMPPEDRDSFEYKKLWEDLTRGLCQAGEFRRIGTGGKEIWISATYNPICDENGRPKRVVKFAQDITRSVHLRQNSKLVGDSVADSAQQMVATISEISERVSRTAELAAEAERTATDTSTAVLNLEESSLVIEKVVEVIQDLADQTNLLALNASIESARAGEAGRSFAVVANEVKELARQTSEATKNIEKSVNQIRGSISKVVSSTEIMTKSVADVNTNMTTISAAVEEQSVTSASLSETARKLRD